MSRNAQKILLQKFAVTREESLPLSLSIIADMLSM